MTTSKLLHKLFKSQNEDRDDTKIPTPSSRAPSSSTVENRTPQTRQRQHQQIRNTIFSTIPSRATKTILSLPGEVRNLIYSFTIYPSLTRLSISNQADVVLSLSIFRISRQIRSEALSYLCTEKQIFFSGLRVANDFFATIGKSGVRSLRHVTVRCADVCSVDWEKDNVKRNVFIGFLQCATGLQRLTIIVDMNFRAKVQSVELMETQTQGIAFLARIKDMVERRGEHEKKALDQKFLALRTRMSGEEALLHLRAQNEHIPKDQDDTRKVFRLCSMNGVMLNEQFDLQLEYLDMH
jgi:hypothetical protein